MRPNLDNPHCRKPYKSCVYRALAVTSLVVAASQVYAGTAHRSPEKVFEDVCAYCHGHYIAPGMQVIQDIRGRNLAPELVKAWVRNGIGVMPAFRHTEISDEELDALAAWIQTSEAPPPPPMPPMPPQAMPKGAKSE